MNAQEAFKIASDVVESKRDITAEQDAAKEIENLNQLIEEKVRNGYFIASKRLPVNLGRTAWSKIMGNLERKGFSVSRNGREIFIEWHDPG